MIYLDRPAWGATLPLAGYSMQLPAIGVHVHHSVTAPTGDVKADTRTIERIGRERFGRFPYSYVIHPSGVVAEGAGTSVGAHTENWNSTTFGVCFIGNYEHQSLTNEQVQAFGELWRHLVAVRRLRADAWMQPHQHRKATACPGAHTMARWGDLLASRQSGASSMSGTEAFFMGGLTEQERASFNRGAYAVLNTNHMAMVIDQKMEWIKHAEERISQRILDSELRQNAALLASIGDVLPSLTPEDLAEALASLPDAWLKTLEDQILSEAGRRLAGAS